MSVKKELYDSLVQEVERDMSLIIRPADYISQVETDGDLTLESPINLETPISALSDYKVRDAVIVTALETEEFAFVLLNKLAKEIYDHRDNPTQDHIEAMAVVINIGAMWEQFGQVAKWTHRMADFVEANSQLRVPSLVKLTTKLIERSDSIDFEDLRAGGVAQKAEMIADLA